MPELTPDKFSEFFAAVHSTEDEPRQPFDWQERLAAKVLTNDNWPDVIRVPTGCGKTSVLDLAVFELALQAGREAKARTAARRICFVIDRRIVVDEVTEHARRIQAAIRDPQEPVVKAVAAKLRDLAPNQGEPLRLVRLRGGVYRDDGWAADPLTPTIIVSTVDQIGSRLLFRGYGVSRRNLPVHAGLLAFDTKIILDEAHLASVFAETLASVRRYQEVAEAMPLPAERRLGLVCMSATARGSQSSFDLTAEDRCDGRLKPRIEAAKEANLVVVHVEAIAKKMRQEQPRKAREQEKRNREAVVRELVRQAHACAAGGGVATDSGARVIGVIVNRVATARQVFEALRGAADQPMDRETLLLTGRIRPFDRDRLLDAWLPRIRAGREHEPANPLFVIATQTVEVGANVDFDALVTEAAPLDALRQRFGRLDRLGKRHSRNFPTQATVVIRKDQTKKSDEDPVYGSAIAETWKWLNSIASTTGKGAARRVHVDFGVNAMDAKLPEAAHALLPMLAPKPETPVLFPAHLDAWVRTNPRPDPDPDVAHFLHGRATPGDVQVVWRADLSPKRRSSWRATVSLQPPLTREALPVPIYELRAWLRDRAEADVTDVEGAQPESGDLGTSDDARYVLRWRGRDDAKVVGPDDVRPGDTVVVPAAYGGADTFGWHPGCEEAVEDIADRCLAQLVASYPEDAFRRPKLRLRVHPSLLPPTNDVTDETLRRLLRSAVTTARTEGQDAWPATARLLQAIHGLEKDAYLLAAVEALGSQGGSVAAYPGDDDGVVVTASVPLQVETPLPEDETEHEGPDGDEASFTGRQIPLTEHLQSVAQAARTFASGCGLEDQLVKTLDLAGRWHDQGKREHRFQAWLRGSELQALAADEPIAKSGRDVGQWKPSTLFGYPRGARHEFISVRLFEQTRKSDDGTCRDLARLLIGTHHGFGRPFVPFVRDSHPIDVVMPCDSADLVVSSDHGLHRLDSGWTDLFWSMIRRFGWWGLAYLEALLITADRTVSAREQAQQQVVAEELA